jgi:hypothetical protein
MDVYKNIQILSQDLEKNLKMILEEIENQKKFILSNAQQDALVILQNAKKLREEIVDRAIRQSHQYLKNIKQKAESKELEENKFNMDW